MRTFSGFFITGFGCNIFLWKAAQPGIGKCAERQDFSSKIRQQPGQLFLMDSDS
jgi:hypothetical protein